MLPSKQMLQRLLILVALLEAGNMSENLLNKIRQIFFIIVLGKMNFKTNLQKFIQVSIGMSAVFTNLGNKNTIVTDISMPNITDYPANIS